MVPTRFHKHLELNTGKKLKIRINDNRSTMLSVRWESDCTKVSLHRMFLQAPQNVMHSLVCYLKREEKFIPANVKFFIEENLKKLDYSNAVNRKKLFTQGSVYDLQKIYDCLNEEYFQNKLDLHITWFGKPNHRSRNKMTFGLYQDLLKLIKIHRVLDNPLVPDYLVSYVVYHEMLHNVHPAYRDGKGIHRIHNKEFKRREMQYRYYTLAQKWIKEHQGHLFKGLF